MSRSETEQKQPSSQNEKFKLNALHRKGPSGFLKIALDITSNAEICKILTDCPLYQLRYIWPSLENKSDQWWYFLDHPEVPPDNNRAERSLRLAVTKRKLCGGSRSWDGFRRSATLLTVIQSCRAQGRSAIDFFRQAISLAARGR